MDKTVTVGPRTAAWLVLGGLSLTILSGCTSEGRLWDGAARSNERARSANVSPTGRGTSILVDPFALSPESERELGRFRDVYNEYALASDNRLQFEHFRDAFARVKAEYVQDIPAARLIDTAIAGVHKLDPKPHSRKSRELVEAGLDSMVGELDPHSTYLNPDELHEMRVSMQGEFGGLGMHISGEEGLVRIVAPMENTPAARAGLKSGDMITHVDGNSLLGLSLTEAVKRMKGTPGTDVRLTIRREGVSIFDVTVTRAIIRVDTVQSRVEGNIGYIRVNSFTGKMDDDVKGAIQNLYRELGLKMAGVVLDLRDNPGGLLDESVFLADLFLESGRIVSVKGRDPRADRSYDAESVERGDRIAGLPLVVLINDGSASASEIVAGALQDHRRATVMGTRSFGKGTVQTIMPLPLEGAVKFTTAIYHLPSGRAIQGQGIEPDIAITVGAAAETRRESSLPGALPTAIEAQSRVRATVDEKECPKIASKDDAVLNCALSFLNAGSDERFMAVVGHAM